jgi:hypothetical protein
VNNCVVCLFASSSYLWEIGSHYIMLGGQGNTNKWWLFGSLPWYLKPSLTYLDYNHKRTITRGIPHRGVSDYIINKNIMHESRVICCVWLFRRGTTCLAHDIGSILYAILLYILNISRDIYLSYISHSSYKCLAIVHALMFCCCILYWHDSIFFRYM